MPTLPAVFVEYKANISELKSKLGEARQEIQQTETTTQGVASKMKEHLGAISTAVGGGLTLVGGFATEAAKKLSTSNADLEAAVAATGKSMEDYKDQIDAAGKTAEKFGHTNDDTNEALAKLTRITGDANKALTDMHLVTEVAAAKHISLSDAADLVGKMTMGNSKAFKQFGVDLDANKNAVEKATAANKQLEDATTAHTKAVQKLNDVQAELAGKTKLTTAEQIRLRDAKEAVAVSADKLTTAQNNVKDSQAAVTRESGNLDDKMKEVARRLGETAENQANTFHGKMSMIEAKVKDATAAFGEKFGPALTGIGMAMTGIGPIIGGVGAVMDKFRGASEAATTATEGLTVAEDAEAVSSGLALAPILAIVAAIVAVGVAIYELWTHWSTVWGWIKDAATAAGSWIRDRVGDIVGFVTGIPGRIGHAATTMWDGIKSAFTATRDWIGDRINDIVDFFVKLPGRIAKAVEHAFDGLVGAFKDAIGNMVKSIPGSGIAGKVLGGLGDALGHLAGGGTAFGNQPYIVGENGPELFIPGMTGTVVPNHLLGAGGGGTLVNVGAINVSGAGDPQAVARAIRAEILRMTRSNVNAGLS